MDYRIVLFVLFGFFNECSSNPCLQNKACKNINETGIHVDNVTYCCDESSDYVDMTRVARGNVTCQCTTIAEAAMAYADQTMSQGRRSCLWGTACDGVEEKSRLDVYGIIFCCHGDNQYVHSTHFGPGNVVCRCHGSAVPKHDQQRHAPPTTMNASSSGEQCSYDDDCTDNPSSICHSDVATFCCYGSRGVETINDLDTNVTRCTCTNEFMSTRCEAHEPFPVDSDTTKECRTGAHCKGTPSNNTCSHGNTLFCCPRHGLNLTIVDDVISSCTCVDVGHDCNVTFSSAVNVMGPLWCCLAKLTLTFFMMMFDYSYC
ncbi:neurogenic locus notch homolog protein 1-like [Littorina saxatilis]|uniref:Uncharacterized protein n=1 Tax=Littorina saxatilis TaxID=31220 RepID=A0AAN9BUF4_9CAEN